MDVRKPYRELRGLKHRSLCQISPFNSWYLNLTLWHKDAKPLTRLWVNLWPWSMSERTIQESFQISEFFDILNSRTTSGTDFFWDFLSQALLYLRVLNQHVTRESEQWWGLVWRYQRKATNDYFRIHSQYLDQQQGDWSTNEKSGKLSSQEHQDPYLVFDNGLI